jgi:hypothetical protein
LEIRKKRKTDQGEQALLSEKLAEPRQLRDIAALEVKIYHARKNAEKCATMELANKQTIVDDLQKELQALPTYVKKVRPPEKIILDPVPITPETTANQPRQRKIMSWTSRNSRNSKKTE